MCGRYTLTTPDLSDIGDALGVALPPVPVSYNVAPGRLVPIIRAAPGQGYELVLVKWGLVPRWSRQPRSDYHTINARAETVAVKPAFRDAFRHRRCLVPADGFYEWQQRPTRKQPWYVHRRDRRPFAFAGLWESWQGEGQTLTSCAIIVTDANALMRPIHGRMPVILPPERYRLWLDPHAPREVLLSLLTPYDGDELVAEPVGTLVNDPRNDGPRLIEPLADVRD